MYFIVPILLGVVMFVFLSSTADDMVSKCGGGPECILIGNALWPLRILPIGIMIIGVFMAITEYVGGPQNVVDNDITRDEAWEDEPPSMPIGNLLRRDTLTDSNAGEA